LATCLPKFGRTGSWLFKNTSLVSKIEILLFDREFTNTGTPQDESSRNLPLDRLSILVLRVFQGDNHFVGEDLLYTETYGRA
jgi:hypothetical protein